MDKSLWGYLRKVLDAKKFKWFLIVLLLLTITIGGVVYFYVISLFEPVEREATEEKVIIEIPSGASVSQVASMLEEENIIRSSLAFKLYLRYKELDKDIMAGNYLLSPSMEIEEIVDKVVSGDVERDTVRFTIPEGWKINQIARQLEQLGVVDKEEFLRIAIEPDDSIKHDFPFLKEVPDDVYIHMEGYLFPDTYEIEKKEISEENIIRLMLQRFDRILTEEHLEDAKESDMTLHEIITLASIIEREAAVTHEREKISSVFHNRKNDTVETFGFLQADPSVQYALGEWKEPLYKSDLKIESQYNTYLNPGLPPGPIASPGEGSIMAALYPKDTDYLYFVSKRDGSGQHYFSSTNRQHEYYRQKSRENQQNLEGE